jgi:hypothetical protein
MNCFYFVVVVLSLSIVACNKKPKKVGTFCERFQVKFFECYPKISKKFIKKDFIKKCDNKLIKDKELKDKLEKCLKFSNCKEYEKCTLKSTRSKSKKIIKRDKMKSKK